MKVTKTHLARTILKVTISMAALVGFAVTSTQQALADSSSAFYNGETASTTRWSFPGLSYNFQFT